MFARRTYPVVTMEENVINGGFGEHVARFYETGEYPVSVINIAVRCLCGTWQCGCTAERNRH